MGATYIIHAGGQPVTNVMEGPLTDESDAKQLAQEISAGQPDTTVEVVSVVAQTGSAAWTNIVATFVDGKPHPWVWQVSFVGPLNNTDVAPLNKEGISYTGGGSAMGHGVLRAGSSRHELAVDAPDGDTAVAKVREVLGPPAEQMTDWTVEPGDDRSLRLRRDDS